MVTRKKIYGILVLAVILAAAAGGLYLALNVKTIKISSDLSCRVTFGKMSPREAARVLAAADGELMPARKYPFARDAYLAVVKYHRGPYRDDAYLGVARTYLAERKADAAYPWLHKVVAEYPRGSVIEEGGLDKVAGGELALLLAKPPLDYPWAVKYLKLLTDAASPSAPRWRQKFEDIVATPFTLAASYAREKALTYVVRETATRDARRAAVFYARQELPAELAGALARRVNFGDVVPPDKISAFIDERTTYTDQVDKVAKSELGEQAKANLTQRREELGLGELPEEWANAFFAADEDTGWVASASVVGKLKGITIAEILKYAGVDPLTGESATP